MRSNDQLSRPALPGAGHTDAAQTLCGLLVLALPKVRPASTTPGAV